MHDNRVEWHKILEKRVIRMSTDPMDIIVRNKRKIAEEHCTEMNQYLELREQIEVYEGLLRPLEEAQIIELAKMTMRQMKDVIYKHKFA